MAVVEFLVDSLLKSAAPLAIIMLAACSGSPAPAPSPPPQPPGPTTSILRGTVSSRNGSHVGATVEVLDGADRTKTVQTTTDGRYELAGVTHGTFSVRASLDGYAPDERRVTLNTDGVQDFRLTQAFVWVTGTAPTLTLLPSHQYQLAGTLQNTGDACASGLQGSIELTLGSQRFSLPLTTAASLGLQATAPYTACCVDERAAVGQSGTATPVLVYQSVKC